MATAPTSARNRASDTQSPGEVQGGGVGGGVAVTVGGGGVGRGGGGLPQPTRAMPSTTPRKVQLRGRKSAKALV